MFVPKKSPLTKNLGSSGDETNFIWSGKIIQWFITWLKVQKSSSFSDILKKVKTFRLQLYTSSPYFSCSLFSSFSWLPHWHGGAKTNSNNNFKKEWQNEKTKNYLIVRARIMQKENPQKNTHARWFHLHLKLFFALIFYF